MISSRHWFPKLRIRSRWSDSPLLAEKQTEALRLLFDVHFPQIYQFIRWSVHSPEHSQQIAADVCCMLLETATDKSQRRSQIQLFHLTRCKIREQNQHRNEERRPADDELAELWLQGFADVHDGEQRRSIRIERARSALHMLAPDQNEVLKLRLNHRLSLRDTASLMGRTPSAVRALQLRAIERLTELIDAVEMA